MTKMMFKYALAAQKIKEAIDAQDADLLGRYNIKHQLQKQPLGITYKLVDLNDESANIQGKFIKDYDQFQKEISTIVRLQKSLKDVMNQRGKHHNTYIKFPDIIELGNYNEKMKKSSKFAYDQNGNIKNDILVDNKAV